MGSRMPLEQDDFQYPRRPFMNNIRKGQHGLPSGYFGHKEVGGGFPVGTQQPSHPTTPLE